MQQMNIGVSLPGYQLHEYMIVIEPHEELKEKIRKVRNEFAEKFGLAYTGNRVHVLLVTFSHIQLMEEKIINRLRLTTMANPAFKVELNNFGSFPSHTILFDIGTRSPFHSLVKSLKSECGRLLKLNDEHKPHFITEPYINLATKLLPWQFEKGWLEYSHRHFTGKFIASELTLLKKKTDAPGYKTIARFELQNLPVSIKQGVLLF